MRLARDDDAGARGDADSTMEHARPGDDPQLFLSTMPLAAIIFLSLGEVARAEETLDSALAAMRELDQLGYGIIELHYLVWLSHQLGKEATITEIVERQRTTVPWLAVARKVLERDYGAAARLLEPLAMPTPAAFYGLQSASEADVRAALDFYRSVGATRYIREGEQLLAATA